MYELDPTNAKFAAAINGLPAPHQMGGPQHAYQNLEDLQKHTSPADISTETIQVEGQYGPTTVTLVRLKSLIDKELPMVFYTHGGGWIMGR
jgi:acetyl esterase/lipase